MGIKGHSWMKMSGELCLKDKIRNVGVCVRVRGFKDKKN